jgi:hypothetical protein
MRQASGSTRIPGAEGKELGARGALTWAIARLDDKAIKLAPIRIV